MATTFYALGTNGKMPNERRETCCYALTHGDALAVFDFGSGAHRLANPELAPKFAAAAECFIFISGFRLDHTIGLTWLPSLLPGKKITIAGAGEAFGLPPLRQQLDRIISPATCGLALDTMPLEIELAELMPGGNNFGSFEIEARRLSPGTSSIGLRLDDIITYAVDTPATETALKLASSAAMLLHECRYDEDDCAAAAENGFDILSRHTGLEDATGIAKEAGVELLALGCLNPAYREGRMRRLEQAARRRFEWSMILNDFQQFSLID